MKKDKTINVTQPFLPPLSEYQKYLEKIWDNKWLTNDGEFHKQFEAALAEYLGVKYISLFTNGTLALVTALQCLRIIGEVVTTPYSFVATSHSLWWNNIKPVFVDVDLKYGNLDPLKIEAAITPNTTAIMPVHVYGNPCQIEQIEQIADKYGLKVIYDAAHAFGVKVNDKNICNFGDLSVLSFHATKVFNTFEGGAIICHDEKTKRRIDDLKNFGIHDELTMVAPGINAKMNEVQAAMGLLQLKYIDKNIETRKSIAEFYMQELKSIPGVRFLNPKQSVKHNFAYFPVFINEQSFGCSRDYLYEKLKEYNIFTRRYFFPLISEFPTYRGLPSADKNNLKHANQLANQVLCLPIYPDLPLKQAKMIIDLIVKIRKK